jgi:hypothetical protein
MFQRKWRDGTNAVLIGTDSPMNNVSYDVVLKTVSKMFAGRVE